MSGTELKLTVAGRLRQLACFFVPHDAASTGFVTEAAPMTRVTAVKTQNFISACRVETKASATLCQIVNAVSSLRAQPVAGRPHSASGCLVGWASEKAGIAMQVS